MYQRIPSQWLKHLDFMVLDIVCMEVAFLTGCALREREFLLFQNGIYRSMAVILFLLNITVVFFCESYEGILRRGYYREFIAVAKQASYILACFLVYSFLEGTVEQYFCLVLDILCAFVLSYESLSEKICGKTQ